MASMVKMTKAYDILTNYNGKNPYIYVLKKKILVNHEILSDFQIDYILDNHDYEPKEINKMITITKWYGEDRKKVWNCEFIPEKLYVYSMIGETSQFYHCYIQYRKSVDPSLLLIPKKAVMKNFLVNDYTDLQVDFERYNNRSMSINPTRRLKSHQEEGVKFLVSRKKCILADDMGSGKMEPISSLIPTPNGYKRMGDIVIGDKIFGSDGKVHNVLNTFKHKNKEIYKVTFSDHTSVECGLEHLWLVRDSNMRIRNQGWKTLSLEQMLNMGLQYSNNTHRNKFEIPVSEPVEYAKKDYFINPYILGMCIGDGNLCNGGIIISIPNFEYESVERINSLLDENYILKEDKSSSCPRYRIILKNKEKRINLYNREIKNLKLNVKGNGKFIPEIYKFGSIEQRLDLLRGLMDSDGTIGKNNRISYSTTSEQLANDIMELVFSLGGTSRLHIFDRRKDGKSVEYHVSMQIKFNPFLIERKRIKYKPTYKKYCHKYIVSAEYVRNEDAQCIMVDSDNHTYLTGKKYIVTHNTATLSVASIEGNYDSVLIICPASLKSNWKDELMWYVPERDITIVDGFLDKKKDELETFLGYAKGKSGKKREELLEEAKQNGKWQDNRFVIINYEILDEFYKPSHVYTEEAIKKLAEKYPLFNYIYKKKSCIIVDEAHRLSNNTSIQYKVISDLIRKTNPNSVFLATGTPVTNNPLNLYYLLRLIENEVTSDYDYYINNFCEAKTFFAKGEREKWTKIFLEKKGKDDWFSLTQKEKDELPTFLDNHCRKVHTATGSDNLDELKQKISHIYLRRVKEDFGNLPTKTIHEIPYKLTYQQKLEYDKLWDEYEKLKQEENPDKELNKELLEGSVYRGYLSNQMVEKTSILTDNLIKQGNKVVIGCCYNEELYTLQEYYGDQCVIYNGKMSLKQKDKAIKEFKENDNVKVFIGNIKAAGVGITLIVSSKLIFNNMSYAASDNLQMMDRIHRIGQTKPCDIYVQYFEDTEYQHIWEISLRKEMVQNALIKKEIEK